MKHEQTTMYTVIYTSRPRFKRIRSITTHQVKAISEYLGQHFDNLNTILFFFFFFFSFFETVSDTFLVFIFHSSRETI